MQHLDQPDNSWVIFRLGGAAYGVPAMDAREMLALPEVTVVPRMPAFIRGVISLRGRVIPLMDLRTRLNLVSGQAEREALIAELDAREEDHKAWLAELEASVAEGRPFRLATDPHKCKFGLWYDGYTTDNFELAGVLPKFDRPHRRIHGIAEDVERLTAAGDARGANDLIARTRDGALARMIDVFAEVRWTVREKWREIAMVIERHHHSLALVVDAVDSVEALAPGSVEPVPSHLSATGEGLFTHLGRRSADQEMVLLLNTEMLMGEGGGAV